MAKAKTLDGAQLYVGKKGSDKMIPLEEAQRVDAGAWDNSKQSWTLSATIENPEAVDKLREEMEKAQEEAREKIEKMFDKCERDFIGFNKECFDEIKERAGEEAMGNLMREFGAVFRHGLVVGWNKCYEYNKDIIERI